MRRATSTMTVLMGACLHLMAQGADGVSLRPSFGADLTSEVQTDFEQFRMANLLQLHADIPLSSALSFQVGSLSALSTSEELEVNDVQGFSNIDTYDVNVPFALTVAGVTWQLNARQSLLKYCCLDTLAMVKVWEKLREMAGV